MRLINVETYKFEEVHDSSEAVSYAILSHTWRDEEVLYADFLQGNPQELGSMKGFGKILGLCEIASRQGLNYVWIDTACIDKTSSAELSEAINSMYGWYQDAACCYVYLDDVETTNDIPSSRWITRGWTLQELIAPSVVEFYNSSWSLLGQKKILANELSRWTGIEQAVLENELLLDQISIANRMSWAASRETSRIEDIAYSLLGIFGVNMPLLYGEKEKAFQRLQEEIIKQSNDHSILAWRREAVSAKTQTEILAFHPRLFGGLKIATCHKSYNDDFEITKNGLRITIFILPRPSSANDKPSSVETNRVWAILNCRREGNLAGHIAIPLREIVIQGASSSVWMVEPSRPYEICSDRPSSETSRKTITIRPFDRITGVHRAPVDKFRNICYIAFTEQRELEIHCEDNRNGLWNPVTLTSQMTARDSPTLRFLFFTHRKCNEFFLVHFSDELIIENAVLGSPSGTRKSSLAIEAKPPQMDFESWKRSCMKRGLMTGTDPRWTVCVRNSGSDNSPLPETEPWLQIHTGVGAAICFSHLTVSIFSQPDQHMPQVIVTKMKVDVRWRQTTSTCAVSGTAEAKSTSIRNQVLQAVHG